MAGTRIFSLRYKFLLALLGTLLAALSIFFYFAYRTFAEDKQLFITDFNLTVLRSVNNEIRADFRRRVYEIQTVFPLLHEEYRQRLEASRLTNPLGLLSPDLRNEVFAIHFFRRENNGKLRPLREFLNFDRLKSSRLPAFFPKELNNFYPVPAAELEPEQVYWFNRSVNFKVGADVLPVGILTLVFTTRIEGGNDTYVFTVDLDQSFLRQKLSESDIAEMFLMRGDGTVLSHSSLDATLAFARQAMEHPILEKIRDRNQLPLVSFEFNIGGEPYLCSFARTGFSDIYVVSQVNREAAFGALSLLIKRFVFLALLIVSAAILITVLLAGRLTANIQKMRAAAERIGSGDFNVQLDIRTNDELQSVSESMTWMGQQISLLLEESAERARMKGELETAQLVQSTLLTRPEISTDLVEVMSYYSPASECGGDFLDAAIHGNRLTVLIGDATGHGAPAALLTAAAKSYSATLELLYGSQPEDRQLTLEQRIWLLNNVIYRACRGQLLMTVCMAELNLVTGQLTVCNAGHEAPLRLIHEQFAGKDFTKFPPVRKAVEVLFSRGERVGFDPAAVYTSSTFQLNDGDVVLLYTDGITEAVNAEGRELGERGLKKAFVNGGLDALPDLSRRLSTVVANHLGDVQPNDDITFALVKWKRPAAQLAEPAEPAEPGKLARTG